MALGLSSDTYAQRKWCSLRRHHVDVEYDLWQFAGLYVSALVIHNNVNNYENYSKVERISRAKTNFTNLTNQFVMIILNDGMNPNIFIRFFCIGVYMLTCCSTALPVDLSLNAETQHIKMFFIALNNCFFRCFIRRSVFVFKLLSRSWIRNVHCSYHGCQLPRVMFLCALFCVLRISSMKRPSCQASHI